jgi:hypothetical protein
VGNIIAAIIIAHIAKSGPNVSIGIMFIPTGTANKINARHHRHHIQKRP